MLVIFTSLNNRCQARSVQQAHHCTGKDMCSGSGSYPALLILNKIVVSRKQLFYLVLIIADWISKR